MAMAAVAPVAELEEVTKRFGDREAVSDLSLALGPGQIFGLIGPSGCGKTTTIRMLVGVLKPTSGAVTVMGTDPTHFTTRQRERIGYTPQGFFLYPTLTVSENLNFVASLFGVGWLQRRGRIRHVLEFLEIWDARDRLARQLSGGMQRRLELACALIHEPTLLFVDEPTAGLDPLLRERIWDYLRTLRSQGTTVFVTTQYIDESEQCDNVAIMNLGRLAAVGSPEQLRRRALGGAAVDLEVDNVTQQSLRAVRTLPGVSAVRWTENGALRVTVEDVPTAIPVISQTLGDTGASVSRVTPYQPTFGEVFKRIVDAHA